MASKDSLEQREFAELIISVDDSRAPSDSFKLLSGLRGGVDSRLADMVAADMAIDLSEGDRLMASGRVAVALKNLDQLLHDGCK